MKGLVRVAVSAGLLMWVQGCRTVPHVEQHERTPAQIEELRSFALRESPAAWRAVVALREERATVRSELQDLRADLKEFGRDPKKDDEYLALKAMDAEIDRAIEVLYSKLEGAYLAYRKSRALSEYGAIMRCVQKDGIEEAASVACRYRRE